ncbi:hepatocyte growth factor receptor-like [Dermacentor variabilis]|uniref:hepatocyte growth factor receptor-like n=1 Tax=Dermacentor variabilis TaxID=34621 RepID=UPI003F5BC036
MDQGKNYAEKLPAVVLLTLTIGTVAVAQAALSIKTFQLPRGPAQKLLYVNLSRGDGVVVVGGRNALYALSPDLSLRALYRTGPENDSALCPPHPLPCEHSRNVTDNYNRILLQIGTEPLILACGVTSQGMCSIHDPLLSPNVTTLMDKNLTDNYVASKKSTVAFFGTADDGRKVLFSASAPDGRPAEYRLFTVAARVLSTSGSFRLLSHTRATSADESDRLKAAQTLRIVYGFSHNGFAYFVVVQKVQKVFRLSIETRLVRVCENDESSFRTYVEVPIMCPPADGALSAATSAYLWPSKSASGGGSGGNGSTDFLAVAFGGVRAGRLNTSYRRLSSSSSVVCFFDMKSLEDTFRKTVENCDNGWGSARLSPLYHDDGDDLKCSHHETEGKDVCTPGRNDYVESMIPFVGQAPITLKNSLATSVTVMEQNGSTVVWVGDDNGFLRKLLLQDDSTRLLASLDLSKVGRMIYRSTALDSNGTYGYFIIDNKVIRFPVGSCNIYESCSQCIHNQEDPLQCGWCGDHCAHFAECPDWEKFSVGRCPIEVERVYPLSGPVSGGTVITILGDNFGSPEGKPYSSIKIIIGNHTCGIVSWDPKRVRCKTPPVQYSSKVDIVISVGDLFSNAGERYEVLQHRTIPSGFEYMVVSFSEVAPNYGPIAGGTNVTLSGVNLDVGLQHVVKIGRSPCRIRRVENKFLHCSTSTGSRAILYRKMKVTLAIDGVEVPFTTEDSLHPTFTYMSDPVIDDIYPRKATFSENFTVEVNGHLLDSAAAPSMTVRVDSLNLKKKETIVKVCRVLDGGRKMLCPGTSLLQFSVITEAELRKHRFAVPAFISFRMDGLHLPPIHLGRGGYFKFDYLPTSELDSYTEQEASANVPLATTRTDNATFAGVKPWYGPAAGGTNITLFGTNLDTGTERSVIIGGGKCTIYRMNSTLLECSTSAVANKSRLNQEMQIVLTIDGTDVPFIPKENLSSKFTYKPDPIIDDVTPRRSTFRQVTHREIGGVVSEVVLEVWDVDEFDQGSMMVRSGNFSLEVMGAHLDSVAQPAMVTRVTSLNQEQRENIRKECRVIEGSFKMQCPGTSLMESSVISPSELKGLNYSVLVWISFQMDGLHLPQAIDGGNGHFTFVYQPEPQFMRFPEMERSVDPSELAVEITGNHFGLFMDDEHVFVRVNGLDDACDVTNVSSHSIVCKMKPGVLEQDSPCALEVVYAGQSYPVGAVRLMTAEQPGPHVGIIAGSTVAGALAAVVAGVGFLLHRRRRQRVEGTWQTSYVVSFGQRHNKGDSLANASNRYFRKGNVVAQQALMEAPFDIDEETRTMLQRENLLVDRGRLHLGRVIGQGHFGCVYRGTIEQEEKGQVQEVAVKTLHNNSRDSQVDSTAFLEEALIMKDFHHVNVLPLIGLSIDKEDGLMVIIPFMKYGDLLSYIRDDRNTPTIKQLITFGVHVAEVMKYLADTKFVHRDLAARNCMLSEDFIVRVADFGLSRDVYEKDYYSGDNKKTKLPVKWMAPESLEKGIYTHKTDVWSYGVLLWELITRGVTPYPEVDNWDIVDFLKQGRRMRQPSFCPDELYDIMLKCWQEDPKRRPSFAKLVTEIPNLVARLEKKKRNKRLGLNVTYINCPRPQPADEAGSSTESIPI